MTWRHLLPALGDAGFHAVAPWLRGYAPTEIPADGRYQTGALAADANALHEALGGDERAVIIGHDWGAIATYGAAAHEPARWKRVVTAAVPPANAMGAALLGNYDQLRRSWYIFFIHSPLADFVVPANDLAFIDRLWQDWSPGYDENAADLEGVKNSLRDPANLAAALEYYRQPLNPAKNDPALTDIQTATNAPTPQPLLYLHGRDDGCAGVELLDSVDESKLSEGSQVVVIDGTGHFLHLEKPSEVNTRIVQFVTA